MSYEEKDTWIRLALLLLRRTLPRKRDPDSGEAEEGGGWGRGRERVFMDN